MVEALEYGHPPTHFRAAGSGPTVLFLHGFNGGSGLWTPNLDDLAGAGFRCIAPDFPGWGETAPLPDFSYRVPDLCRWLLRFLDAEAPGPLRIVGHSFGGAVALHLALMEPERVERLVLVNSAGLSPKTLLHYRLLCLPGLGEWLLTPHPGKVERELRSFAVSDLDRIGPEMMDYILKIVKQPWFTQTSLHWVRRNGVWWRGARGISVRHRLHEVRQPVLLMVGEQDPIINPRDSLGAARLLPDVELKVFPEGMHLLTLDYREEFRDLLVRFFGESPPLFQSLK